MPSVSSQPYSNVVPQEKSYFTFVAGLNTDATPLAFPENFSSDEENFVLNLDGSRQRRKGLALEVGGQEFPLHGTNILPNTGVMRSHFWRNVNGDPNLDVLVVQSGYMLYFFEDAVSITQAGTNLGAISLLDYKLASSTQAQLEDDYVNIDYGRGHLFVVGKHINPFYVEYDPQTATFTETLITIEERDFEGIEDGAGVDTTPTALNESHEYNLKNAGWTTDFIQSFYDSQSKYPAKNMIPWRGQVGVATTIDGNEVAQQDWTKLFSPDKLVSELFQDVPAPIGHFIRNIFDTSIVVGDSGSTSFAISTWRIDPLTGGNSSTMYIRTNGAHGLATSDSCVIEGLVARYNYEMATWPEPTEGVKNWIVDGEFTVDVPTLTITGATSANPVVFTTSGSHNLGTGDTVTFSGLPGDFGTNLNSNTYEVTWLSATTFSIAVNGGGWTAYTTGGTATGANLFAINIDAPDLSLDFSDQYYQLGTVWTTYISRTDGSTAARRPTAVAFYAGRIWYAGVQTNKMSHKLYFSQIVETDEQYGKCYQVADPTSQYISDLVASDGGSIAIPEMDTVRELISYSGKLLVFADNGVWEIGGGDRGYFTANGYSVRQISNVGCTSASSVVVADGSPFFWSDGAIFAITQDPNFGFLTTTDISTGKIQKLLVAIPKAQKEIVQSCYDKNSKKIYWLYGTATTADGIYANWLVYDLRLRAFSKFSNKATAHFLKAIYAIEDYQAEADDYRNVKFLMSDEDGTALTFAELNDSTYEDFGTDAQAYVETGNDGLGDVTRRRFGRYLFTFMERTETGFTGSETTEADDLSECYVRYLWNWADSSTSGAWSTPYSVYRRWMRKYRNPVVPSDSSGLMGEPIAVAKSKIRGSGKVLKLRFTSEASKHCHLYGWHLRQDINREA